MKLLKLLLISVLCLASIAASKDKKSEKGSCKEQGHSWKYICTETYIMNCEAARQQMREAAVKRYYQAERSGPTLYISARPSTADRIAVGVFAHDRHAQVDFKDTGQQCTLETKGDRDLAVQLLKDLRKSETN